MTMPQIVKTLFGEHETSFSHMDWPSLSPDLNPTENVQDALEITLHSSPISSSIQNLGKKCMRIWTEINVVTPHKVIEIMPRHMRVVIKAKGGPKNMKV